MTMQDGRPIADDLSKFEGWLRSTLERLRQSSPSATSAYVRLEQNQGANNPLDVDGWTVSWNDNPTDLVQAVWDRAEEDAHPMGGASYFVKVDGVPSRWTLRFEGPSMRPAGAMVRAGGGYNDFQPRGPMPGYGMGHDNPMAHMFGIMAQREQNQTQHVERIMELALSQGETLNKAFKESQETVRSLERARVDNIGTLEELSQKKHERDLENRKEMKAQEMKEKAFETFVPIGLGVAARFLGAQGISPQAAPILEMLFTAFKDMKPEQLMKIHSSGIFNEQQIIAIMETMKTLDAIRGEEQQKEAAAATASAARAAPSTPPNSAPASPASNVISAIFSGTHAKK